MKLGPSPSLPYGSLVLRLGAHALGEVFYLLGNLLPLPWGLFLWRLALGCNPYHIAAAVNRALALKEEPTGKGWDAFRSLLECIGNPRNCSASDLYLTWIPGRRVRSLAARMLWGKAGKDMLVGAHDRVLKEACITLAAHHFRMALASQNMSRAGEALMAWESLEEDSPDLRWARVEFAWACGAIGQACAKARPLVEEGLFPSPLDPLRWAGLFLRAQDRPQAKKCLEWAERWVPEESALWAIRGQLAWEEGRRDEARLEWERALSRNPEDVEIFLRWLAADRGWDRPPALEERVRLRIEGPAEIALGERREISCSVQGDGANWTLFVLPPAGWGVVPETREARFDPDGKAKVNILALRPDRVRGGPWPLHFVAANAESYRVARAQIAVPDPNPGSLVVVVTEDHEIQEERAVLPREMLRRLLVEKSKFASSLGVPWTHMVEAGSTLAVPAMASVEGGKDWQEMEGAIRSHLVEDVARGNDIQPHLHSFNLPHSRHFPYTITPPGLRASLRFLLTSPEKRGDFASSCPPPGWNPLGLNRLEAVAEAVALVEEVGRRGHFDYRPVLWRSGLLDYGHGEKDCAWSAVALRRAGLLANSDMPKPASPFSSSAPRAFLADWGRPFTPRPGGILLQMPMTAGLEGDYLMGGRLLRRRARRVGRELRRPEGGFRPGVHLFTLVTHDKFINARRGGDEFSLDVERGDWRTVRKHIEAWQKEGAIFRTAGEGIKEVLEDLAWHPVAWLEDETFVARPGEEQEVRCRVRFLGRGIPFSDLFPQHALVTVPPSLRALARAVRVDHSGETREEFLEEGRASFWVVGKRPQEPVFCTFRLSAPLGPWVKGLEMDPRGGGKVTLQSPAPWQGARILLPWDSGIFSFPGADWDAREEGGRPLHPRPDPMGLILGPVDFQARPGENGAPPRVTLRIIPSAGPANRQTGKMT